MRRTVRSTPLLLAAGQILASLAFSCGTASDPWRDDSGRGGSPSAGIIGSGSVGHFSCQLGPTCYRCPTRFDVSRCSTDTGAGRCMPTEMSYCD